MARTEAPAEVAVESETHDGQLGKVGSLRLVPGMPAQVIINKGEGTLLDHSMVVYGSCIGDGNRHNHDDLPLILAGRGGGTIRTGRVVKHPFETPVCNLYLSMLDRLGVKEERFGDSTGRLPDLA